MLGTNFRSANLKGADFECSDLRSAIFRYSDLRGADLGGTNLLGADLQGAKVNGISWPAPTAVLLANWGNLSDQLTADLMLYDSMCHPDPSAFDRWASEEDGPCPYEHDSHVDRAAHFSEKRHLWGQGEPCRPYDLMMRVLEERCDLS